VTRWDELRPEAAMVAALDDADEETARAWIEAEAARIAQEPDKAERKRLREPLRDMRKRWSERLAAATATMLATEVRRHKVVGPRFEVSPGDDGTGQETFFPLGYRSGKRIDVAVSGRLAGLQMGASLKGLNFRDDESGYFDKNMTGRFYELADEMATVHRHLPQAFLGGFFFMPVEACADKAGQSSFAHVVLDLRRRSGRDRLKPEHNSRCDFAAVALYSSDEGTGIERGVLRFFPVALAPPRRGLPPVDRTLDLREVVDRLISGSIQDTAASDEYGPAEGEEVPTEASVLDDVVAAEVAGEVDEISLAE
jgi:hypothetical protein